MKVEQTKVTSITIHVGEVPIQEIHVRTGIFNDLYGFLILENVSLVFDSKESIDSLYAALTQLKDKWLVEEQSALRKGVTESA